MLSCSVLAIYNLLKCDGFYFSFLKCLRWCRGNWHFWSCCCCELDFHYHWDLQWQVNFPLRPAKAKSLLVSQVNMWLGWLGWSCFLLGINKFAYIIYVIGSAFKQQRLPAWQPILTAGTVLPAFFVIGVAFVPIGVGLLYFSNDVSIHSNIFLLLETPGMGIRKECFPLVGDGIPARLYHLYRHYKPRKALFRPN